MSVLENFSEDINKCSKCGLCQAVCPIYKLTGNECAVSKGKFVMLNGVLKGDLHLNKTIDKYLNMCLKCGKCSEFCPSGIDVCKIFNYAKMEYLKENNSGKLGKFLFSENIFDKSLNTISRITHVGELPKKRNPKKNLLFFKGCADKIFNKNELAIKNILSELPYNLYEADFKCCGVPFCSAGLVEQAKDFEDFNTKIINSFDCDYVLTDCASCADSIRNYQLLQKPVMTFAEFFTKENLKFKFDKKYRVTFHKPCHLKNYELIEMLLNKNCENVEYIRMKDYDECCGFAGQFVIKNFELSSKLIKNKIKNALDVSPDIILTECPSCIAGLRTGLFMEKHITHPKVMNISQFLALANI